MSTKVDGYKSLLTYITIAQNVAFHKGTIVQIVPVAPGVGRLIAALCLQNKKSPCIKNVKHNRKNA